MSEPLRLYVKTWCSWCIRAQKWLDDHGYRYELRDVLADRATYDEMIRLSGQRYTPTLVVGDKLLADFGPEQLDAFLKENAIQSEGTHA